MRRIVAIILLGLSLATVSAAATVHCTTQEEPAFKPWGTTCIDGTRSLTRWNQGFQRWDTAILTPSKQPQPPSSWPPPGKPLR
jgi:hypothetical protein